MSEPPASHSPDTIIQLSDDIQCRICYESTPELFRPCRCQSHVHRTCLNTWRESSESNRDTCEICMTAYTFTISYSLTYVSEWYMKYRQRYGTLFTRYFNLFVGHVILLTPLAGIFYGLDGDRKWASALNVHHDSDYRVYYGTIFLVWYFLCELTIWRELFRFTCGQFCYYVYLISCRWTKPHVLMLITIGYYAIFYVTVAGSVFIDIPASILFLISHYEIHIAAIDKLYQNRIMIVADYTAT